MGMIKGSMGMPLFICLKMSCHKNIHALLISFTINTSDLQGVHNVLHYVHDTLHAVYNIIYYVHDMHSINSKWFQQLFFFKSGKNGSFYWQAPDMPTTTLFPSSLITTFTIFASMFTMLLQQMGTRQVLPW